MIRRQQRSESVRLLRHCHQSRLYAAAWNGTTRKPVWTSSNTKVATVGRTTGKVTAKKAGTAVITAKLRGKERIDAKLLFVPAIRSFIRASLEGIRSMTVTMS